MEKVHNDVFFYIKKRIQIYFVQKQKEKNRLDIDKRKERIKLW